MRFLLLFLALALSLPAQQPIAVVPLQLTQFYPTDIGYEWNNEFDFPAGTYTLQYGCTGKWSAPATLIGPVTSKQLGYAFFGLKTDITGCPGAPNATGQPAIQVAQQPNSFAIGVHTWTGSAYGPAVPMTIPSSSNTVTIPVPISGHCTWTGTAGTNGTTFIITLNCTSP